MCTPGMGVNLWGDPPSPKGYGVAGSPLYVNPVNVFSKLTKVLADSKGVSVRKGLKGWSEAQGEPQARATKGKRQPRAQSYEPTDRNSI